ncbi:MAG: ribokinase [Anaerolineales bacterium]|nr:ribokinase [Anaerolineales bacterium]
MNEEHSQIIVVGSHVPGLFVRVHRVPLAGETVMGWDYQEPIDGGKGSNQAIAAAKLGMKTSFVGCLGNDRLGREAVNWMSEVGVDLRHTKFCDTHSTGVGFIILDDNGVPAMVATMGANEVLDQEHINTALNSMRGGKVMLTQFEIRPEMALYAASVAMENNMIAIVNPAPAADIDPSDLSDVDIVIPNEAEAKLLLGYAPDLRIDPLEMAEELRDRSGVVSVIITLGERGIVGSDSSGSWLEGAPKVEVVDTSGAGDVFCAAFAVGIAKEWTYRRASAWACQVAALSVTRAGTIPAFPTIDELEDIPL